MTLLSRKRLMGISLIALVALSACTDDVDGDRGTGLTGHRLSFIVSMDGEEAQTRADGSGTTAATQYFDPVELKGKQGGKSVYLQAEETDGFPGEGQPLTRGTQISSATDMNAFAVSIYSDPTGTPDQMYNKKVENVSSTWTPEEDYHWPKGQKLSFFAWHPYGDNSLSVTDENTAGAPVLTYTVPKTVEEQQDLMTAVKLNQSEGVGGTRLQFKHTLSAVRFTTGSSLSKCTLHYIKLKGVKYKGSYSMGTQTWTLDNDTTSYTFTVEKEMDGTPNVAITGHDQTFLLLPQSFADNEDAELEVSMTIPDVGDYVFSAKLKDIFKNDWKAGKSYICRVSDGFSDVMDVNVTFFKGVNGTDGKPYTSHNISANGDPVTIDITYPYPDLTAMETRWAYEKTSGGVTTYTAFGSPDLTGYKEHVETTSPCMNNTGKPELAEKNPTPFVFQIKITSPIKVKMPADPKTPNTRKEYNPVTDNDTWYTVWRGTMYPPNYIDTQNKVIMSRNNATHTYKGAHGQSYYFDSKKVDGYFEVDERHPTYGTGKWVYPGYPNIFASGEQIHKTDLLVDMLSTLSSPGGNDLYGAKVSDQPVSCWLNCNRGWFSTGGGSRNYWWLLRGSAGAVNWWKCYNPVEIQNYYPNPPSDASRTQIICARGDAYIRLQIQY